MTDEEPAFVLGEGAEPAFAFPERAAVEAWKTQVTLCHLCSACGDAVGTRLP